MLTLSEETTKLAEKLAEFEGIQADEAVYNALHEVLLKKTLEAGSQEPKASIADRNLKTAERLLALGVEIATLPVRDSRPIEIIFDEVNAA